HSIAARTALRFATLNPDMVQSLTIEDFDFERRREPENYVNAEALAARVTLAIPSTIASREQIKKDLSPFFDAEDFDYLVKEKTQQLDNGRWTMLVRPEAFLLYDAQTGRENLAPLLGELKMPVLLMRANRQLGGAIGAAGFNTIRNHVANLTVANFENAGHS